MRVLGLTAAVLFAGVLGLAAGYAAANAGSPLGTVEHTCSATDRKFIRVASLNMVSVGVAGREYLTGKAQADEVLAEVDRATTMLKRTSPTDPALSRARLVMSAMLQEYGTAIDEHTKEGNPGHHMYRAYGLANFAHDLLVTAEPHLRKRGCDMSGLL